MKKFLIFISVLFALPVYAQSNRATLQSDNSATFTNCGTHCITGSMLQNWNNLSIQSFGVLQDGNTWTGLNNFTGGIEINGAPAIFPAYAANNTALSVWPSTAGPVTRLGYAAPGDSTTVTYAAQAVCPYAGTQPDGGACVPTSDGQFWVLQTNGEVDGRVWGWACNAQKQVSGNTYITAGSNVLVASSAAFTPSDVGATIAVPFAGTPGVGAVPNGLLTTTIATYVSPTQVTLAATAGSSLAVSSNNNIFQTVVYTGGNADDGAKINQTLAVAGQMGWTIVVPTGGGCRSSVPVIVPNTANLRGASFSTQQPPTGSMIVADLGVNPAVNILGSYTAGGTTSLGGQYVHDLTITRALGTVPTNNAECLLIETFHGVLRNINCDGHSAGYHFKGVGSYWITAHASDLTTCNITGTDLIADGFAEIYVNQGRFGCAESRSTTHGSYVSITDFNVGTAAGPNTIYLRGIQYNSYVNPTCAWSFNNLAATGWTTSEFKFLDSHIEFTGAWGTATPALFCTDSTVRQLQDVEIANNTIVDFMGGSYFMTLNPTTWLSGFRFANNFVAGFGTNWCVIAPIIQSYGITVIGNNFANCKFSVVGVGATEFTAIGNNYENGVNIAGSFGPGAEVSGTMHSGSLSFSATTPVRVGIPGIASIPLSTFGVAFGGTAATLSSNIASWQYDGSIVTVSYNFVIGSTPPTGGATLTGLPFTYPSGVVSATNPMTCTYGTSLPSAIFAATAATTKTAVIQSQGASIPVQLTNTNFPTGTACSGMIQYRVQ